MPGQLKITWKKSAHRLRAGPKGYAARAGVAPAQPHGGERGHPDGARDGV